MASDKTAAATITASVAAEQPDWKHLSHSRVECYQQCPRRFELTYLERVPRAPAAALLLGTAVHSVLEDLGRTLRDGRELPELLLLIEGAFLDAFDGALLEADPDGGCFTREELSLLVARGQAVLRLWCAKVAPRFRPLAIEESFDVAVPPAGDAAENGDRYPDLDEDVVEPVEGWAFTGRLDARTNAVQKDGHTTKRTVVDWKILGKPWPAGAEHEKPQAAAYTWGAAAAARGCASWRGQPPEQVSFLTFYTSVPDGWRVEDGPEDIAVTLDARVTRRYSGDVAVYQRSVRQVARNITRGTFPARPSHLCGWCGCLAACTAGRQFLAANGREPQPEIARFMERQ